jgi:hypothetical protein
MDPVHDPAQFLRALKGAPMSVFMALRLLGGGRLGTGDLVVLTGYSPKTVTQALRTLSALGLVEGQGRYRAWALTAEACRLSLGGAQAPRPSRTEPPVGPPAEDDGRAEGEAEPLDPEKVRLASRSRRLSDPSPGDEETTTTTTRSEAEGAPLPEPWQRVALSLTSSCAIPPQRARRAVRSAMGEGRHPGQCLYYALSWYAYCRQQTSFRAVPFFVLARVKDGTPPPDFDPPTVGVLARKLQKAWDWWHEIPEEGEELPY